MSDELIALVLEDADDKMAKAIEHTRHDFASIRTGRASPALIEKLLVDVYGSPTPLQQIASISTPEARQLLISPWDKSNMGAIEKAIQNSDLGLTPSNDGVSIRLSFPPLTEERRKALVKVIKQMAEDGRISLRNTRREGRKELEALEKDGEISSDALKREEDKLDKAIHKFEAQIDELVQLKEEELLEV